MHDDDSNDQPQRDYSLDEAVASHYAREQAGLPPPDSHPGYDSMQEAFVAHRRWLTAEREAGRLPAYPPAVRSAPPPGAPLAARTSSPTAPDPQSALQADPAAPVQPILPGLPPEE